MSAGLPAVTKATQTGFSQRFFQEVYTLKTTFPPEIVSLIFAYYNSKIKKPTYAIQLKQSIKIPETSGHCALACSTWGGGAITYFHTLFKIFQRAENNSFFRFDIFQLARNNSFFQHLLELFDPGIAPPIGIPYSGNPPSPLLTGLTSSDALIYAGDVGFTANGTTLTLHERTITSTNTGDAKAASSFHYPIVCFSGHDRVRVMAYNPRISTLMMGTTQGVVASREFTQASEWREFPRASVSIPVHFLASRHLGFIAVSPLSIREFGKRSILKVIASASDVMQFRTAAYNPDHDTLGVVCRFEGFDTVRQYSLATGTYRGEMLFETQVIALCSFNENWVIVTETASSSKPGAAVQSLLILNLSAGEIHLESHLTGQWQQLPPEASQVMHKQYLAMNQADITVTPQLMFPTASELSNSSVPMAFYSIIREVSSTSSASSSGTAATEMQL